MTRTALASGLYLLLGLAVAAVLVAGTPRPTPTATLYGVCPTPTTSPTSVCYDAGLARARYQDALVRLEIAHGPCRPPGPGALPRTVLMKDPAGDPVLVPSFGAAWADAHHGYWTLAFCAR